MIRTMEIQTTFNVLLFFCAVLLLANVALLLWLIGTLDQLFRARHELTLVQRSQEARLERLKERA